LKKIEKTSKIFFSILVDLTWNDSMVKSRPNMNKMAIIVR